MESPSESTLLLPPESRQIIEALAEQNESSPGLFMQESIIMGLVCAEIYLDNTERGITTTVFFERENDQMLYMDLDFLPPESDPPIIPDEIAELNTLFTDESGYILSIEPTLQTEIEDIVPRLNTDIATFLNVAVSLRWQFGISHYQNERTLISVGDDECIIIDYDESGAN